MVVVMVYTGVLGLAMLNNNKHLEINTITGFIIRKFASTFSGYFTGSTIQFWISIICCLLCHPCQASDEPVPEFSGSLVVLSPWDLLATPSAVSPAISPVPQPNIVLLGLSSLQFENVSPGLSWDKEALKFNLRSSFEGKAPPPPSHGGVPRVKSDYFAI